MNRRLLLVLLVAAVWRAALLLEIQGTPLGALETWDQSDMATFWRQAERIAAGDGLGVKPYYPYHAWMRSAPADEWARWHPPAMFYQPPLYSFGLAALMRLGLDAAAWARWLQWALGVAACGLMVGLTARLLGRAAGTAAGLLLAVDGPLIVAESQLLRDGPVLAGTLLALWLAVDTLARSRRGALTAGERRWRAWLLGLLVGMLAMAHESAVFLGLLVAAWGAWDGLARGGGRGKKKRRREGQGKDEKALDYDNEHEHGGAIRRAAEWATLLALGAIVGFGPLLARNAALGAPLGPRYFGSLLAFAAANHPDNPDDMLTMRLPADPARFAADMRAAQGRAWPLAAAVARGYDGQWRRWALRWGRRVLALCVGPEHNENLNYAFFRRQTPILALAVDYRWLWPLALAGAAALGRRRWRARMGGGLGLTLLFGLTTIGLVSAVYPFGRYRLMFLPLLAPLAGFALVKLWASCRRRAWPRAGALAGAIALLAASQHAITLVPPWSSLGGLHPTEFLVTSRMLARWGHPEAAAGRLREGLGLFPGDRRMQIELALADGMALQGRGDFAGAAASWKRALALDPANPLARLGLETASQGRPLGADEKGRVGE